MGGVGGGAWEGEEGSHGMLLDAWDELLGIRIQPAVDLGEKKKTLVTSPEVEPSSPLIGRRLDSPPQCQSLRPGGCPGGAPAGPPAPAAGGGGPWRG